MRQHWRRRIHYIIMEQQLEKSMDIEDVRVVPNNIFKRSCSYADWHAGEGASMNYFYFAYKIMPIFLFF